MSLPTRLLVAVALAAHIAGCGETSTTYTPPGRVLVPFWFMYGGRNRTTLETLVTRFNQSQSDVWVHPVFQGDYFEGLAKLRTALAAGAAPPLSHVIGEVVPYLAAADVLEPLDDYPGARELGVLPALGQAGSFRSGARRPLMVVPFNRSTPIAYVNQRLFAAETGSVATWDELRRPVGEALIDAVTAYAPNFRDAIEQWQLFTPSDIERRVGMTDGNIHHLDMIPSQLFAARPLVGWADYRTPIPGLWMCGAGPHPGGEISGVPGHNAAHAILDAEQAPTRHSA